MADQPYHNVYNPRPVSIAVGPGISLEIPMTPVMTKAQWDKAQRRKSDLKRKRKVREVR